MGRLEAEEYLNGPKHNPNELRIVIHRPNKPTEEIKVPVDRSHHGGGDKRLRAMLFSGKSLPDPLGQMASSRHGVMSAMIGIAANHSMVEHRPVGIEELLQVR